MYSEESAVTLDRAQRAALRRELETRATEADDLLLYLEAGNRGGYGRLLDKLTMYGRVMDAIGWQESAEAPDLMKIDAGPLAAWAATTAEDMARSLAEAGEPVDPDSDLDALSALQLLGATGKVD